MRFHFVERRCSLAELARRKRKMDSNGVSRILAEPANGECFSRRKEKEKMDGGRPGGCCFPSQEKASSGSQSGHREPLHGIVKGNEGINM